MYFRGVYTPSIHTDLFLVGDKITFCHYLNMLQINSHIKQFIYGNDNVKYKIRIANISCDKNLWHFICVMYLVKLGNVYVL